MATTYTEYAKFNFVAGVSGSDNKEPRIFASGSSQSTPKLYISQSTGIIDLAGGNSLTVAGDSGSGDINLGSDTFTIAGTSNEVDTSFSGTTLTVGLPTNVTVAGNLTLGGNLVGDADENKEIFAATTTATNTITLGGGGKVVAAGDLDVADDVTLSSDSAVLSLGAGADATLTHDGTTGLTIAATPISIDSTGGLDLNSTTGDINFQDGGTNQLSLDLDGTAGEVIMQIKVDSDDFVFKQFDGTEVFRVEDNGDFDIAGGLGSSGVTVSSAGAVSADGRIVTDDTTEATSTTDGSLQTDGGLSVAKSAVVGDDLDLLSDSAILSMGAGKDATLTHDGTTGLTIAATPISINSTGNLTLDSSTDIILDAGGADILFKDDGTQFGAISQSSSKMVISASLAADLDLVGGDESDINLDAGDKVVLDADGGAVLFKDGGTLQLKLNMAHAAGQSISSSVGGDDILFELEPVGEIARFDASATSLLMASTNKIEFNDATQFIHGSSTADLSIGATTDVNIDCTTLDVNAAMDVSGQAVFQTGLVPDANDGAYLGQAGTAFSDLFLAEGGVINWDSGDVTMTQAGNLLTITGGNTRVDRLEVDSAADYLDVDTDLKVVAAADIVLDPAGGDVKVDGNMLPNAADGGTLGSADLEWSDLFLADSSAIKFGDDQDTTLTHTDGTGLTLNGTNKLCFQDTATFINSSADGQLDIDADVELEITAPTLDIDASTAVTITSPSVVIDSATSDKPQVELKNTNADANPATLLFNKDSASPADDDELGEIVFNGDDDGGTSTMFAKIVGSSPDVSNGSEDGELAFKIRCAGAIKEITMGNGTGMTLPNDSTYGVVTAHSYATYSDETLKTNINPFDNALDTVKQLNGVTYDWKNDGKSDIGFIAQDVQAIVPEVVHTDRGADGHLGLDYSRLTAILVEAVKELASKLEDK